MKQIIEIAYSHAKHRMLPSALFFSLVLLCVNQATMAGTLPLPGGAREISRQMAEQCDNCLSRGFSPTGTVDIGFGKRFWPNFFMGQPARGILVSYVMTGEHFLDVVRNNDLARAREILRQAFSETRLFVIEEEGYRLHAVMKPKSVEIALTEQLHKCLAGSTKPLCCCCTDCASECCEKKLGSTAVTLRWDDPQETTRTIAYTWYPHAGASQIITATRNGEQSETRWCLDSAGPGYLK